MPILEHDARHCGTAKSRLLAMTISAVSAAQSTEWIRVPPNPTTDPSQRFNHAMTFDSSRGEIVLLGGKNATSTNHSARTWVWTGASWLQRTPANSPAARANHAMAHHAASGLVALFGGDNGAAAANVLGDTWAWNGTTWTPPMR